MRIVLVLFAVAALVAVAQPSAHGTGYTLRYYSQTYQLAAQGAITVVCPQTDVAPVMLEQDPNDPTNDTIMTPWVSDCVAMGDMPGAPADKQLWVGGVGIDLPLDAIAQKVIITDASGTATPAGVCVDHNMNNLCGPSDNAQDPMMPEHAVFFCGEFDDMATQFPPMMMEPGMGMMMTQHIDVWVRSAGGVGWPTDQVGATHYGAPFCGGDALGLPNSGPAGVGTRGTVTITALVPN